MNIQVKRIIYNLLALTAAIAISQAAGIIGAFFTTPSIPTWYADIAKPGFTPPDWIFGPVWTSLFTLMGISAFLVWKKGIHQKRVKIALGIFVIQLALNTAWSILFFGFQNPGVALFEIILLWIAILATILTFAKISKPAALLLAPYIIWVSFAAYLNYAIWILN